MVKDPYFVRIEYADELRVSLLESSKLVLHCLQSYYQVVSARKKKVEAMDRMKHQIKELVLLVSKFEDMLPYQELVEKASKKVKVKRKPTVSTAKKEVANVEKSTSFDEVDKLNRALASIEDKLNKLA